MDVVGEKEALQQFFEGQDVHRVLENGFVDTHMLEEFLENDFELFGSLQNKLPDSPPDSESEPCSPPQSKVAHYDISCSTGPGHPPAHPSLGPATNFPCNFLETSAKMDSVAQAYGTQQDCALKSDDLVPPCSSSASSSSLGLNCPSPRTSPSANLPLISKKRKHPDLLEDQLEFLSWPSNMGPMTLKDPSLELPGYDSDGQKAGSLGGCCQSLAWQPYCMSSWNSLFNHNYEKLPDLGYHIVTNKGFNFSAVDYAFICQKKNHFQITVYIRVVGSPKFVKTDLGLKPVETFYLKTFGIKMEAPNQVIVIEQSQPNRSKKPFYPVKVDLPGDQVTKVTMARLHFGETTANNMRKKGKPNPDQRYFLLVAGLYAFSQDQSFLVAAHVSEKIIVRASNPGQFETDSDTLWQQGHTPGTITCRGQVGINTDTPDEALVVCGNMKVMGTVMHPSDRRAKQNIQEADTHEQLRRIAQMRLVEYDYKPEFASVMGITQLHETGVIAQEVQELLPRAVRVTGDLTYENGEKVDDFLMVDKDQIFMENVGAVKQLCKLTNNLEVRIQELESWNQKLARLKRISSINSATTEKNPTRKYGHTTSRLAARKPVSIKPSKVCPSGKNQPWTSSRIFKITVIALVAVMALCVVTIATLYVLSILDEDIVPSQHSNSTSLATLPPSTTLPVTKYNTASSNPIPTGTAPEVSFCGILPCHETYCCPIQQMGEKTRSYLQMTTKEERNEKEALPEQKWIEKPDLGNDWVDTRISSMQILETQQKLDHRFCNKNLECGSGKYSYVVPLNKHIPLDVKISLEINTTEPLIIFQCKTTYGNPCSHHPQARKRREPFQVTTQGFQHIWVLPIASMFDSAYHFRVAVPDLADCSMDPNYAGLFFTDYYFYFYRNCI